MSSLKRKSEAAAAFADASGSKKPKVERSITSFFGAPKPTATSSASGSGATTATATQPDNPPATRFDKEKWVQSLTDEQRQFLKLEIDTLDPSWLAVLKDEITTREFIELKKFLDREARSGKKVFPPREDVYSWSRHTPFHNVKCVIVGQDPYHNVNQAHGLAFSVRPPTDAPPSLRNMYKALAKDYPGFTPPPNKGGLLTPWAERGVLMLNTCLTVRAHEAFSHKDRGWERLTQRVIDLVAQKRARGVVFIAWGAAAAKRVARIDARKHLVLKGVHPSPLSASRGFFDCGHFRKTNEWLASRYGNDGIIDWDLNPAKLSASAAPTPSATANGSAAPLREAQLNVGTKKPGDPLEKAQQQSKQPPLRAEDDEDVDEDEERELLAAAAAAETADEKTKGNSAAPQE